MSVIGVPPQPKHDENDPLALDVRSSGLAIRALKRSCSIAIARPKADMIQHRKIHRLY